MRASVPPLCLPVRELAKALHCALPVLRKAIRKATSQRTKSAAVLLCASILP